ncbi:MAG TPA: hypothetical protein VKU02_17140 [Gemmataceae bacterium]|nr:hypothetical protein [Gemmataceae bacterium]
MQRGWFLRAKLAIALGLGVMAGALRAQEPLPLPSSAPPPAGVPVSNHAIPAGEPLHYSNDVVLPEWRSVGHDPVPPSSIRERMHNCVTKYLAANVPIFCWASHNSVGCGNFCSEFNFIFGSCKTFYGETCYKGPPPVPVPLGNWYGQDYWYVPPQQGCSRCP